MTLRVLENFAGIGTQRMALENLGIDHEVVGITEIDKFAIKSYEAIHGKVNNLGDISLVDPNDVPDHDLFTYSFPCQDISVAGKGKGFEKGSGTRSGLLWECEKVIRAKKPKYLLMENVKNLVSKKFLPGFEEWLSALEELGYTNYWQVLNAKDFGIPQNRERVFCVSILGEHEPYEFPEKETLELRLKDILEHEVDEKFYLDNDKAKQLIATVSDKYDINETTPTDGGLKEPKPKEVANTILARYDAGISNQQSTGTMVIEPKAERIGGIFDKDGERHQAGAVWDKEQLAPTLDTMQGGWRQPSVLIKNNIKQGYIEAIDGDTVELPTVGASRGRNPKNPSDRTVGSPTEQRLEINKQGTSNTITTVQKDNYVLEGVDVHPFSKKLEFQGYKQKEISPCLLATDYKAPKTILEGIPIKNNTKQGYVEATDGDGVDLAFPSSNTRRGRVQKGKSQTLDTSDSKGVVENLRIRKLTPKECWRLMGISDDDFEKAQEVNSNTQLYKQAGNAIVVDVLEAIFANMFK